MENRDLAFQPSSRSAPVRARLWRTPESRLLFVCAHGAGAGMDHPFLAGVSEHFLRRGVATFRYQFPYMEAGKGRPDPPALLEATVRAAVAAARDAAPALPIIAGGKSLGGRMTSTAQARRPLEEVQGLAFLGFPLHPPKQPSDARAAHLPEIAVPLLFLQGTRDALADLSLLRPVCERLGPLATLHVVEGADHGFEVLKRSGRTGAEVLDELALTLRQWADRFVTGASP